MGLFFFDFRTQSGIERDEDGLELTDVETAYLEAHRAIVDIWADARRQGLHPGYRCVEVRDSLGQTVLEIPITEALGVRGD
jgi:hypothetical protein